MDNAPASSGTPVGHPSAAGLGGFASGEPVGVRGWLLALCVFFVLVAPSVCLGLIVVQYQAWAPRLGGSAGSDLALVVMLAATACSAALGVHAGWGLWVRRADAVATVKMVLLIGLGLDILATAMELVLDGGALAGSHALDQLLWRMVPGALTFSLCYGYLNKSRRVHNTYPAPAPAPEPLPARAH